MIALRWALTVILALLWLLIAATNASYEWRELVRKEKGVPSVFPLAGGLIAWLAAMACPSDSPLVTLAFWLALILDVGSLPYGVLAIVALTLETVARTKQEEHFWKRSYLGSSCAVKFAVAVLG